MALEPKTGGAVIVCERSSRIAARVRAKLPPPAPIVETRTVDECWQTLEGLPASMVVIDATNAGLGRSLRLLDQIRRWFPGAQSVVVADRELKLLEPVLREAGATHVTFGLRAIEPILRLIGRHAERFKAPATLRDELWQRLPWDAE